MIKQISVKNIKQINDMKLKVFKNNSEDIYDNSVKRAIRESEEDIKKGRVYDGIEVLKELRSKYGYK